MLLLRTLAMLLAASSIGAQSVAPWVALAVPSSTIAAGDTIYNATAVPFSTDGKRAGTSTVRWATHPAGVASAIPTGPHGQTAMVVGRSIGQATIVAAWTRADHRVVQDSVVITVREAGEPTYARASGATLMLRDNIDAYVSATAMGAVIKTPKSLLVPLPSPLGDGHPVGESTNQVIAPGRDGTGKALRLNFPGAYQSGATWGLIQVTPAPDMSTHVWTYWARITVSAPIDAMAVKWFEAWHRKGNNTRIQWDLHNHLPWRGGTRPTYWQVYDQGETESQGAQPVGPYWSDLQDGEWHRYTYTFRPNSAPGARDGFTRMWIDGVKVIDISSATVGVTPAGGEKAWCNADDIDMLATNDGIIELIWGSVQTQASPPWTLDIDDVIWWVVP